MFLTQMPWEQLWWQSNGFFKLEMCICVGVSDHNKIGQNHYLIKTTNVVCNQTNLNPKKRIIQQWLTLINCLSLVPVSLWVKIFISSSEHEECEQVLFVNQAVWFPLVGLTDLRQSLWSLKTKITKWKK